MKNSGENQKSRLTDRAFHDMIILYRSST